MKYTLGRMVRAPLTSIVERLLCSTANFCLVSNAVPTRPLRGANGWAMRGTAGMRILPDKNNRP